MVSSRSCCKVDFVNVLRIGFDCGVGVGDVLKS